jgi:hypothetical protein
MSQTVLSVSLMVLLGTGQLPNGEGGKDSIKPARVRHHYGKVVQTDEEARTVFVRVSENGLVSDKEYKIGPDTLAWGLDQKPLPNRAIMGTLKKDMEIWFLLADGLNARTISELRLVNPAPPPVGGK